MHAVLTELPDPKRFAIECEGRRLVHRTPILAMCRELVADGYPPETVMVVRWDDGRPSMRAVIGKAALLTIADEDKRGLRRKPYQESPFSRSGGTVHGDSGQEAA